MTDKVAAGIAVEGMESLAPVLVDELELLVDVMPADTQVVVVDPERVRSRAHDLVATSEEFLGASWAAAAGGGTAPIDLGAASYRDLDDVREHSRGLGSPWWTVSPFGLDDSVTDKATLSLAAGPVEGSQDRQRIGLPDHQPGPDEARRPQQHEDPWHEPHRRRTVVVASAP